MISDYARSALRNWYLLLLVGAVAAISSYALASSQPPTYRAEARFIVGPRADLDEERVIGTLDALDRESLVTTFAEVLTSGRVFEEAAAEVGLDGSEIEGYDVTGVRIPEANVVHVSVQGRSPVATRDLTTAIGDVAAPYFQDLYRVYAVERIEVPKAPVDPVAPKPLRDGAIAAVVGVTLGFLLGLALDGLRARRLLASPPPAHATLEGGRTDEPVESQERWVDSLASRVDPEVSSAVASLLGRPPS